MQINLTSFDTQEALRYLGGTTVSLTPDWLEKIDQAYQSILKAAQPRWHYKELLISDIDNSVLIGKDIHALLENCKSCLLFCATLGSRVEHLLRLHQVNDMAFTLLLDACASAAIEQVCDDAQLFLADLYHKKNLYMTSRFSCGYGDYPLTAQNKIISLLDAPRQIGLSVNSGGLLIPTKSVTAVIGLSPVPTTSQRQSCSTCSMRETCNFRRKGVPCGK